MALPPSNTVAVIGAGSVGSAIAQSLILRRVVAELVIVDVDEALCRGQVLDLSDAASLMNIRVRQGCHSDAGKSDIIIISSGAKQRPGETRLSLIDRNLHILRSVLEAMKPIRSDAILLLVANPVDVLTYFAQQLSGLPRSQVLGSGTLLDSVRLRGILGPKLQVAETAINAYVVGEHGDSQCIAWSMAGVIGSPLQSLLPLTEDERSDIAAATRAKADEIISAKGFTSYGIGAVMASICQSIVHDERQVLPLSHWREDFQCCLSLPVVLGRRGAVTFQPLSLSDAEMKLVDKSATNIKSVISSYT